MTRIVLGPEDGNPADNDDGGPPIETRYSTIDVGTRSSSIAEAIAAGDEMMSNVEGERLTITDVYAIPTSSETADVTIHTEGTQYENGTFAFGGNVASGQNISVQTDEYDVTGPIETVENTTTEL